MNRIALVAALYVLSGCGSAPVPAESHPARNRGVLAVDEIRSARGSGWSAYDLIAQLRPEYLKSRGVASLRNNRPATALVYIDGRMYGGLESLRSVSADDIVLVEYVNASEATTRFGTDHFGGAILIKTR